MSITASVEVKKGIFLPLNGEITTSKAIATFVLELHSFCSGDEHKDEQQSNEIDIWFAQLASRMRENICLIAQAEHNGNWTYSEIEYEKYLNDKKAEFEQAKNFVLPDWMIGRPGSEKYVQKVRSQEFKVMPKGKFLEVCKDSEQKWTDTDALKRCIDDLIRVIDEIHPQATWWYDERHTLPQLRDLSKTLAVALQMGYQKVRISIS